MSRIKIKDGIIHAHTDNSLHDSVLTPEQLVKRAAEYGAPAVVLTDHGTLTGVFAFLRAAKEYNIKAIPGVEAYIQEDDETTYKRSHMLLIPKNYAGYQAIMRAVTKSNTRMHGEIPCMNIAMLYEFFGKGTQGHGNVIATSACVGGILSRILLMDRDLEKDKAKLSEKLKQYNDPNDPKYKRKAAELFALGDAVQVLMKERDRLGKLAARKFHFREKALDSLKGEDRKKAEAILAAEKRETDAAARELPKIKEEIAKTRKQETALRQECRAIEKTHAQWIDTQEQIDRIQASLQGKSELYCEMKRLAKKLENLFGSGNFYIELQYHGIPDEEYVMPLLAGAARELRLPTVAANDIHYSDNAPDCVRGRQLVQSMRFNRWHELQPGDTEYYIKDDEEMANTLLKILSKQDVEGAMRGISDIISQCSVVFPAESHLPKFKGGVPGESTRERLKRLSEEGIAWRYPVTAEFTARHRQRMEYELEIIEKLGYSDYLCIVQDFLNYGRRLGTDNPDKLGFSVGPGRGSALGSLVCYLTGITNIDPLKYGLLFERFLNEDRVSMPDIDSDFDMEIRGKVVEYVKQKYGENAVCCILAKGTLAAKAAVRSVARVMGDELYGDARRLYDKGSRIAGKIPSTPGVQLSEVVSQLETEFGNDELALKIIHDAQIVEGAAINHSMHAAGVIISDNADVGAYIPLMYNKEKEEWMSQCDMKEAEKQGGLIKMDFLGLRTLNIISDTLRAVFRNRGVHVEMEKVPFEAEVFRNIFSKARTTGVFQFEGNGMRQMLRQFQPESIEDLILAVAVYRPGPLQYLKDIISNKHGKTKPKYMLPQMEEILAETYGKPVYQEQLMMIAHKIAGLTMGEADVIRAAISKKKLAELVQYQDRFIGGLEAAGASRADAENFWKEMQDFGKYAFNKSHACAYAHMAYYTAYLKEHYPTEFLCATLNYTPVQKLPLVLRDCAEFGITVLPPDVNESDIAFRGSDNTIRFGLGSIKTVKDAAETVLRERENGPFASLGDFVLRTEPKKNTAEALIKSGALDCLCSNRLAMLHVLPYFQDDLSVINKKKQILKDLRAADAAQMTEKEQKAHERKIKNASGKLEEYSYRYEHTDMPVDMLEDPGEKLEAERDLIGIYLSGNPLDNYPSCKTERTRCIRDIRENERITLCGIINEVTIRNRAADNAPMAFFQLSDETGEISVCCFVKPYSKYHKNIKNGAVLAIKGRCVSDGSGSDEDDAEIKLIAESVKPLAYAKQNVIVSVDHLGVWTEQVYPIIFLYYNKEGYPLTVYDRALDSYRRTQLTVSDDVLFIQIPNAEITLGTPK